MHSLDIVIVTPAPASANNGNWQTAQRWCRMLSATYRVRVAGEWHGGDERLLVALHARRSAASVARWRATRPGSPIVLVLTGTDLYQDIAHDADAQASLDAADTLVVLNELGPRSLPVPLQDKARIVLQSCSSRRRLPKPEGVLHALTVGHLRDEKSPQTCFGAMRLLAGRADIRLDHLGAALDPALGLQARALMSEGSNYRWLGELPQTQARRRIQAAHVLVHPSWMEGGAHVVIEAVRSGTPVLASRIDGNVGLLGEDYAGYFPPGDAAALAAALVRLREEPALLQLLEQQCQRRDPLFEPAREREALFSLVAQRLSTQPPAAPAAGGAAVRDRGTLR